MNSCFAFFFSLGFTYSRRRANSRAITLTKDDAMEVWMTDMCRETFLGADAYVEEFSHLNSKDNTIELIHFLL